MWTLSAWDGQCPRAVTGTTFYFHIPNINSITVATQNSLIFFLAIPLHLNFNGACHLSELFKVVLLFLLQLNYYGFSIKKK